MKFIYSISSALMLSVTLLAEQLPANQANDVRPSVKELTEPVIKKYIEELNAVHQQIQQESDPVKKKKLVRLRPNSRECAERVLKIAENDLKSDGAIEALIWVIKFGGEEKSEYAKNLMFTEFKNSSELQKYVHSLTRMYLNSADALRAVADVAELESVKVSAKYELACALIKQNERDPKITEVQKLKNKEEALAVFKSLRDVPRQAQKYPKLMTAIEGRVFKMEKLAIGCVAPDIVGVDQTGEEFKLSDYRGKVVLLDFWGHW